MSSKWKLAIAVTIGTVFGAALVQGLHAQAKPPAYAVVEIDATNPEGFLKEFQPKGNAAITGAGGKFLARGGKNLAIDGEAPKPRALVVAFDSFESAQAAFATDAYREARKIGDQHAKFRIWIIEGVAQ